VTGFDVDAKCNKRGFVCLCFCALANKSLDMSARPKYSVGTLGVLKLSELVWLRLCSNKER